MTDSLPDFDHDKVDRTLLLRLVDGSAASLDVAIEEKAQFEIHVTVDDLSTRARQAAFFAALGTAKRAAGKASASVDKSQQGLEVLAGEHRGITIAEAVAREDIEIRPPTAQRIVELLLGPLVEPSTESESVLRFWWSDWSAHVQPGGGRREVHPHEDNVLAAIAAAGLAVHEAFGIFRDAAGRDDGYRPLELNLWAPDHPGDVGPALRWAPASWWLVGLGHLGQANAWVLSWLGLPENTEITLQDDGVLSEANHSTGMLTPTTPLVERKSRQVARALEAAGMRTRVIEDRYWGLPIPEWAAEAVALFGVDDVRPRRLISDGNWKLALDVGLGTGQADFDGILLHRFPGATRSDQIRPWQDQGGEVEVPKSPAFLDLLNRFDACGVTELAGTAVGAAFVGMIAATLAIAEAVRPLHEGAARDVVRADLGTWVIRTAIATAPIEPAAVKLE